MMENSPILGSVIVLVAWSLVMWIWMYATRIPAIAAAKMELDPNAPNGQQMAQLPPKVRWKADNYNHLMEQPTIFYALAITLAVLGEGEGANAMLAWAYVGLRIVHSLVQVLVNKIEVRFTLFSLSTLPLFALTYNAATAFFSAG
ncbi:MAPEG family protein [Litorivivens sp.]|uniref:MAPEG family protein n=1 Tax=Litorivivens sp. TaxID=2020868 RepID=UPI003566F0E9